jgi:hypothetical protein
MAYRVAGFTWGETNSTPGDRLSQQRHPVLEVRCGVWPSKTMVCFCFPEKMTDKILFEVAGGRATLSDIMILLRNEYVTNEN